MKFEGDGGDLGRHLAHFSEKQFFKEFLAVHGLGYEAQAAGQRLNRAQNPLPGAAVGIEIAEKLHRVTLCAERIRERIEARAVRCRVRAMGVVIEIDSATLEALTPGQREDVSRAVAQAFGIDRPPSFEAYRNGSAFLK